MTATESPGPYSLGDTIYVPGRSGRLGYVRALVSDADVAEANAAYLAERLPNLSDIVRR